MRHYFPPVASMLRWKRDSFSPLDPRTNFLKPQYPSCATTTPRYCLKSPMYPPPPGSLNQNLTLREIAMMATNHYLSQVNPQQPQQQARSENEEHLRRKGTSQIRLCYKSQGLARCFRLNLALKRYPCLQDEEKFDVLGLESRVNHCLCKVKQCDKSGHEALFIVFCVTHDSSYELHSLNKCYKSTPLA